VYSWVTCNSTASRVAGIAAITGETGSRVWKSTGPNFTCTTTLVRKRPSSGAKWSYAARARSVDRSRQSWWWL
jgi:hypothetical protein